MRYNKRQRRKAHVQDRTIRIYRELAVVLVLLRYRHWNSDWDSVSVERHFAGGDRDGRAGTFCQRVPRGPMALGVRSRERIGWQAKAPAPQERKPWCTKVGQTLSSVNPAIPAIFSRILSEGSPGIAHPTLK
jgi:hypothetical protein